MPRRPKKSNTLAATKNSILEEEFLSYANKGDPDWSSDSDFLELVSKYKAEQINKIAEAIAKLAGYFDSHKSMAAALDDYQKFSKVAISQRKMAELYEYFTNTYNLRIIDELGQEGVQMKAGAAPEINIDTPKGILSGEVVLVTGKFDGHNRNYIENACILAGAIVVKTFSRTQPVTLLICGDKPGANKVSRAQRDKIKTWDKHTFYEKIAMPDNDSE